MELIWANEALPAKDIAALVKEYIGWEKNTTYTVINRLINKGAVTRSEPGFICTSNISKETVQKTETDYLVNQLYDNKVKNLITDYIAKQNLTVEDLREMKKLVDRYL
ncbi:MAG: BlaI/MecI/CopY family transcriptional regulator [Lachnospiraceae bacterium]|nr:BlaI/MecI/CopY family transcriptional regulator [Lachnospiraceae bacterium]